MRLEVIADEGATHHRDAGDEERASFLTDFARIAKAQCCLGGVEGPTVA